MRRSIALHVLTFMCAAHLHAQTCPLAVDPPSDDARGVIKSSVVDDAFTVTPKKLSLAKVFALTEPEIARGEFTDELIPSDVWHSGSLTEGTIVSVTGWLRLIAGEDDGDYHIQLSTDRTGTRRSNMIVEVPCPLARFEPEEDLRQPVSDIREWLRDEMLRGKEPGKGGNVMTHPPCVTITGQLFLDSWHLHDQNRGKKGMKAATDWEIHPIINAEFAPVSKCQ